LVLDRRSGSPRLERFASEEAASRGIRGLDKIEPLLARLADDESLPALARSMFAQLGAEFAQTQVLLKQVSAELIGWHRRNELSRRLTQIPGVGPIAATMLAQAASDQPAILSAPHAAECYKCPLACHSARSRGR
jgi:transposase